MNDQFLALRPRQGGIALLISLVLLLIVTLVGVAAARMQTLEVRMATNTHNRNIAVQAGEATLRFAEGNLLQANYSNFGQNANGLYLFDATAATPWYQGVTWSTSSSSVLQYSSGGPNVSGHGYATTPLFIVEQLPSVTVPGESISLTTYGGDIPPSAVYRITARATGGDGTSTVTLQSIFH